MAFTHTRDRLSLCLYNEKEEEKFFLFLEMKKIPKADISTTATMGKKGPNVIGLEVSFG